MLFMCGSSFSFKYNALTVNPKFSELLPNSGNH